MDDHLSLLQLWAVEKALILYINELNSFATLISDDFDDSDHENMKILAMDIDNALTLRSDSLFLGLSDENEHTTPDQVRTFINAFLCSSSTNKKRATVFDCSLLSFYHSKLFLPRKICAQSIYVNHRERILRKISTSRFYNKNAPHSPDSDT